MLVHIDLEITIIQVHLLQEIVVHIGGIVQITEIYGDEKLNELGYDEIEIQ